MRVKILFVVLISALSLWGFSFQKEEHPATKSSGEKDTESHMHGEEHHESDHMTHMSEVREWLMEELGDKYTEPVADATDEQLNLGKEIYRKSCVTCHGTGGKGDGPAAAAFPSKPADFTNSEHSKFYSDQGRIFIIRKGIQGTPMVGWEKTLSDEEINAVHAYVRSLRASEESGHGHNEKEEHPHEEHPH